MTSRELTCRAKTAKTCTMQGMQIWTGPQWPAGARQRTARTLAMLAGGTLMLGGCISVNAPDKPIVIELNINIKQEVIYRLAADAAKTIEQNPDLF